MSSGFKVLVLVTERVWEGEESWVVRIPWQRGTTRNLETHYSLLQYSLHIFLVKLMEFVNPRIIVPGRQPNTHFMIIPSYPLLITPPPNCRTQSSAVHCVKFRL